MKPYARPANTNAKAVTFDLPKPTTEKPLGILLQQLLAKRAFERDTTIPSHDPQPLNTFILRRLVGGTPAVIPISFGSEDFFSLYRATSFSVAGVSFSSVDHFVRTLKHRPTSTLEASTLRLQINANLHTSKPDIFSRRNGHLVRLDWAAQRESVLDAALWFRYSQNKDHGARLLATGIAPLEYLSSEIPYGGQHNLLGKCLMKVRSKLQRNEAPVAAQRAIEYLEKHYRRK
jgi:predicted NAD-dependent protein-ADP-ribosyltransferase YbiA (DUF1768 family)